MKKIAAPISLAGSQLGQTRHVCAFFNSDEEEYRVLLPFIKDGFECGDKAIHVVSLDQQRHHLQRIASIGIDSTAVQRSGRFDLRSSTETYLQDGRFDQDRMLQSFEQMASGNAEGGFPLSRIVCRMDWMPDGQSHIDDLIEFEARVNDVWCRHDDAVICTYRLSKFSGDAVIDIMRTHPLVIVGGILQHNPFFVSDCVGQTRCLILDIAMPGMTGPGLQQELKLRRQEIPIVFITAQRDETVRSRMLEQGAVECLFKPFSDTALLQALNVALRVS